MLLRACAPPAGRQRGNTLAAGLSEPDITVMATLIGVRVHDWGAADVGL